LMARVDKFREVVGGDRWWVREEDDDGRGRRECGEGRSATGKNAMVGG